MTVPVSDRVSFDVRAGDYLNLHSEAIRRLNEFFGRDILTTKPIVRYTLEASAEAESLDGKTTLWRAEVKAWLLRPAVPHNTTPYKESE